MAAKTHRWTPEVLEAMRKDRETMSAVAVGKKYGISRERVRQLIGNANRQHPPGWKPPRTGRRLKNQQLIIELFALDSSDEEIAAEIGLSSNYVRRLRLDSGFRRNFSHTPEHDIECALKWHELFGYTPAAADWNPAQARVLGHNERAERFESFREEYGCSYAVGTQKRHGSWNEFIAKTGLSPAPIGGAALGLHTDEVIVRQARG